MPYPPKKNPKLIEEVLSRIAKGETLASLARELDFHPITWQKWVRDDEELAIAYAEAREVGHDALAEQTLDIADNTKAISEHVQLSKLRIDTRLKLLASWAPKKYGPKATVDVGNKEGEALKVDHGVDTTALTLQITDALRSAARSKG